MIYTAFQGTQRIAVGSLAEVAVAVRMTPEALVFDAEGKVVDIDARGSETEIRARLAPPMRSRGRPSLGVQAREVTLLPRQWDWLAKQPGGASAALRRIVDAARRSPEAETRAAREAAYRFMSAIAGDLPGYEEALRALFAGDGAALVGHMVGWPKDVRDHALKLAETSNQ
jgi:hypothetical protein